MSAEKKRNKSVLQAVATSLGSKVSTSVLQFFSLPLAARCLGREEFGVFATVATAIYLVIVFQIGVGPALSRSISEASSEGKRQREGVLYANGWYLVIALVILAVGLGWIVVGTIPIENLFGEQYRGWERELRWSLYVGIFLMGGQIVASQVDRLREGYMEAAIANSWIAVGNLIGAGAVLCVSLWVLPHLEKSTDGVPSAVYLLIAIYFPNILVRTVNLVFLLRKRKYLLHTGIRPDFAVLKELLRDGISFSATMVMVSALEMALCGLLVGRILGPKEVAVFHFLVAVTTAFVGLIAMVGTPLWAAIVDSKCAGDYRWLVAAAKRYYLYYMAVLIPTAIVLVGFGPTLIQYCGKDFQVDRIVFAAHFCFLMAVGWRHVNRFLAIGLGLLPRTVLPIVCGVLLGVGAGIIGLLPKEGLAPLYFGLAAGTLFVSGILLPRMIWKEIHALKPIES